MGIFSKKFDYDRDSLECKYDLARDEFCFYLRGERIDNKSLSLRSRNALKSRNRISDEERQKQRMLATHYEAQIEEFRRRNTAVEERRINGWPTLTYDSFEILNSKGFETRYSNEVKEYLEDLTSDDKNSEYIVGIHRIGSSEEHLGQIFYDGIRVQGHMMGAAKGKPELANTVGYYPTNSTILKEVALADSYKSSRGSIVVKIPKEDIASGDIYIKEQEGDGMYLNPKYIVGYFPIEDDKTLSKIVTKDNLIEYKNKRREEAEQYISLAEQNHREYPPPSMD